MWPHLYYRGAPFTFVLCVASYAYAVYVLGYNEDDRSLIYKWPACASVTSIVLSDVYNTLYERLRTDEFTLDEIVALLGL
jgi:hypothetical protein